MGSDQRRRPALPNPAKPVPNRNAIHRRDAEIAEISAEKTKTGRPEGVGFTRWRGRSAEQAESAEERSCQFRQEFDSAGTHGRGSVTEPRARKASSKATSETPHLERVLARGGVETSLDTAGTSAYATERQRRHAARLRPSITSMAEAGSGASC